MYILLSILILLCIFFYKFYVLENLSWPSNVPKGLSQSKRSIVKTTQNTIIKTYKSTYTGIKRYYNEKIAYNILQNSKHIPALLSYDDNQLSLEFEDAGLPIRFLIENKKFEIPNWRPQIEAIIADLDNHDITHGDWSGANLLYHTETGLIKVIDFGVCRFPGEKFYERMRLPSYPLKGQTLRDYIGFIDGGIWKSVNSKWKLKKKNSSSWTSANELNQNIIPPNYDLS